MAEDTSNALFDDVEIVQPDEVLAATGEGIPSTPDESAAPQGPGITLEGLQSNLDQLNRANVGLRHALTDERGKRQQYEGRLQGISETFANALEARGTTQKIIQKEPEIPSKVPVSFEEDGTPFVKADEIARLTKIGTKDLESLTRPQLDRLEQRLNLVTAQLTQGQALQSQRQAIDGLLSSNPSYPEGLKALSGQWQHLNRMYDQYIYGNSLPVPNSIDEAMQQIIGSPVAAEFERQFPGSDVELLIETFTTPNTAARQRKLRRALDMNVRSVKRPVDTIGQQNLTRLSRKPSNLGNIPNQVKSANTTIDRVADMSLDDFMKLSDSDIEKVQSLLAEQE